MSVTEFAPSALQSKLLGDTTNEAIPQLSELPLFTSFGVIEAVPPTLIWTVKSWQIAVGDKWSSIVMVAWQLAESPLASTAWSSTTFIPMSLQSNNVCVVIKVSKPHSAMVPSFIALTSNAVIPEAFS